MNYQPIPVSAGHKFIKGDIAPHLDFGLDDKIEIKVNRNAKFEAMRKLFDERDIIYLSDFARLTKYPSKLHSMAKERGWVAITDNNRVVGYRKPKPIEVAVKPKPKPKPKVDVEARLKEDQKLKTFTTALRNGKQTLSRLVEIDLRVKGETNIDKYTTQGHSRETFHAAIFRMRNKGLLIVRQGDVYKLVG